LPLYEWQGRDLSGQPQRGTLLAETLSEAQERLREQGIRPSLLRPVRPRLRLSWYAKVAGARPSVLAQFFQNLHQSVRAGVPLTEALELLARSPTPLSSVARYAAKRVQAGVPLSQALAETGFALPPFVLPILQAGERSGKWDETLGYLAHYFEQEHRLWLITWGALMGCFGCYAGCLLPVLLLIVFWLPNIMKAISPDPQWAEQFYQRTFGPVRYLLWGLVGFLAIYLLNGFLHRHPRWALWWEGVKMRLPLIGLPLQRHAAARFGRVLAMLYEAGVSPSESLLLAGQASGNLTIAKAARLQAERLKKGASFSSAVSAIPFLPHTVLQAIAIGERTGNLEEGLKRAAEMLEQEAWAAKTAKPFVLTLVYYGIIVAVLGLLVYWSLRSLAGLYLEAWQWVKEATEM